MPDQAALYRLTGDLHPIHIDPAVAEAAGFQRPILHGLATLGQTALALARSIEAEPWALEHVSVRFGAPVLPGDAIDVLGWTSGGDITFKAAVGDTDVLSAGSARFSKVGGR